MLSAQHLEDYVLKKEGEVQTVELGGNQGHCRLNESLLQRLSVNFDLNEGFFQWTETPYSQKLDIFLQWMMKKSPEGDLEKVLNGAKFVSRRGILVRMAKGEQLREDGKGDWQIVCERRGGIIYLQEEQLEKEKIRKANPSPLEKSASYWGHRFEEYMTLPANGSSDIASSLGALSINNPKKADLRMVMSATLTSPYNSLQSVKLLYSGEIDAVDSAGHHIEMKTIKKRPDGGYGYWFYKEKSLSWWLQSRLVNVDYLVLGIRDDYGKVKKLEKMNLNQLPNKKWNANNCLAFLLKALLFIDASLSENSAGRVTCKGGKLSFEKISSKEADILTQEFIDHFGL